MPIRIFTIPFDPNNDFFNDEELSKFLLNKKVRVLKPEFFQQYGSSFWTVFVEYDTILSEPSFHQKKELEHLDNTQKVLYQRLREWRKEKSGKEKIPVYVIATNGELIRIVKQKPVTSDGLSQISGFGKKKVERHGKEIIEIVTHFLNKDLKNRPSEKQPEKEQKEQKQKSLNDILEDQKETK